MTRCTHCTETPPGYLVAVTPGAAAATDRGRLAADDTRLSHGGGFGGLAAEMVSRTVSADSRCATCAFRLVASVAAAATATPGDVTLAA
jgi:hypothetical protein